MTPLGVSFDKIHTYRDLGFVLSKSQTPPPRPKLVTVSVPGRDGELDLTESLGEIKFEPRELQFSFTAPPDPRTPPRLLLTAATAALAGRRFRVAPDFDEEYYYLGRVTAVDSQVDGSLARLSVTVTAEPYKYRKRETVKRFTLTADAQIVKLPCERMSTVPTVACDGSVRIDFGGETYSFTAGEHKERGIRLREGENELTVSGSGTVTFRYRNGTL